jgi:hypothetical protein
MPEEKMKRFVFTLILVLGTSQIFSACESEKKASSPESLLNNADAHQAMALANQWKWSQEEIKSYVTSSDVVFEFPDGKIKRIPLPADKMVVAIAPYVKKTHT